MQPESIRDRFGAARRDETRVVLEGFHAIKHALRFGAVLDEVVTTDVAVLERLADDLAPDLAGRFAQASQVTPEALAPLGPHARRAGVVALAARPRFDLAAALADARDAPLVLLEDPRDLGNLGACVRVAAAADVAGVLTTGAADPWSPEAVRGAAGLQFALPVGRIEAPPEGGRPLVAVDPGGEALDAEALPPRAILAFGTERQGLSDAVLAAAVATVRIPMRDGVSSLNLATAVAAVLFAR